VYFHGDAVNYAGGIFSVPAAGGTPIRLNGNGTPITRGYQVSVAPDHSRLIFNSEAWKDGVPGYLDEELVELDLVTGALTQLTAQPGNQYGWFAFNGQNGEYVMQSSTVAGGPSHLFTWRNNSLSSLYTADPGNVYDDTVPAWWMPIWRLDPVAVIE